MSRRNIDENWRKPRVAKGTPLYKFSNILSLGVLAVSGGCWFLYEHWSVSKTLTRKLKDGEFDYSPETKLHIEMMRQSLRDESYHTLLCKLQDRMNKQEDVERPEPWYVKYLYSKPET